MADLFNNQAQQYSEARPDYPLELFHFIASKTPQHALAWDVGTGNAQAARILAVIYKEVIATDTSQKQLDLAPRMNNIRYQKTPPKISDSDLQILIGDESTVDLITVAQALHWFDLPSFYRHAHWILRKPDGVLAAWCYTLPEVTPPVDYVLQRFYAEKTKMFWDPARKMVDDAYRGVDFPFEKVEGVDGTGPVEFVSRKEMDLEMYLTYVRSWSAYQRAKEEGIELLEEDVVADFKRAWLVEGDNRKIVRFPLHLRIGKVGNSDKFV